MSVRILFHRSAEAELNEVAAFYISCDRVGLAEAFLNEAQAALMHVEEHPNAGSQLRGGIRSWRLRKFPYSIIYRIRPDHIRILAIAGHRRRPEYWRRRR